MLKLLIRFRFVAGGAVLICLLAGAGLSRAQPFGMGIFGANVPFGSQTSLTISTSGDVTIPVTPSSSGTLATGSGTVTITSTDVVGYKLYIRSDSSNNLTNGAASLPASANGSPGNYSTTLTYIATANF